MSSAAVVMLHAKDFNYADTALRPQDGDFNTQGFPLSRLRLWSILDWYSPKRHLPIIGFLGERHANSSICIHEEHYNES